MATIYEFGTAPAHALEGYRINSTLIDTDAAALDLFSDRDDIRLVRGASVFGRPGVCEFAVMVKQDSLYFDCRNRAERFAEAVIGAGFEAAVTLDEDAYEFDDPFKFIVTYTGPQVTDFSLAPYSALGRMASRFTR